MANNSLGNNSLDKNSLEADKAKAGLSRRRFLLNLGCASLGTTTLFSSLTHLGAVSSAAAQGLGALDKAGDYRALVCILLAGGNDSFNMLVPTEASEYAEYRQVRGDLALGSQELLPLQTQNTDGRSFSVHPGMPEVQQLFNQGDLAFVANVGTLVERLTLQQYNSGLAKVPLGLFSHADQIDQWQTALPDRRSAIGWGGRLADVVSELHNDSRISMNISLAGTNIFQAGRQTVEYSLTPQGSVSINGYGGDEWVDQLRTSAIDSLMNQHYRSVFETAYADKLVDARDSHAFFSQAITSAPDLSPSFTTGELSASLQMIARTMAVHEALGQRRQTFFVIFGGWDHHDQTLANQQRMLPVLSRGLSEFQNALTTLGLHDQVTTFTISDFGRTLTSNGKGSDHGWGGHQLVMGGGVHGGRIFGDYPRVHAGNSLDTGRGRLIPTLSVDEYFADLALWFGVQRSDLDLVLPNVGRFYDLSSGAAPIGFMKA